MTRACPDPRNPRRRWLQFSLRTMLVFMLLAAGVAAWLGYEYRKGQRQKEAIAWVEEMGGTIEYDDEATQNDWRRRVFGELFPQSVLAVSLYGTQVSDLAPLSELENLKRLSIDYSQVTDLAPLAKLENLTHIGLSHMQVSDLTALAGLNKLESLGVSDTQVSELAPLTTLEKLEWLNLQDSQVSDVTPLAKLENLVGLDLVGTQVTDLMPFDGLENLRHLYLYDTEVSDEQVQALREALPNCQIDTQPQRDTGRS